MSDRIKPKKSFFAKRIPTLVGLGVLVIALIAGTLLFSQGTGVFAPRANPQTTPKKIRISNLTDSGFTVSFITDEATVGHIKYGTDAKKINSQSSDDRDQLSGTVDKYNVHHITVRGLEPNSTYYYTLGTGSGNFDNNGQPFTIKTAQRAGVPSAAKTIYGSVVSPSGSPAEGVVVYVKAEGVGEMSSLVKSSGSWAIPLSNARMADGSTYAQITDDSILTIFVQGATASLTSEITTITANAQPVDNITLGQSQNLTNKSITAAKTPPNLTNSVKTIPGNQPSIIKETMDEATTSATQKNETSFDDLLTATPSSDLSITSDTTSEVMTAVIVDLEVIEEASGSTTVNTTQPKIIGKATPNATISIQVHSDTQIDQYIVADSDGNFELDISQLEQELEPGEHTVTYSYEDPVTGETVTKTQTFYVSDTATQLAQADTSGDEETSSEDAQSYPYSSSNPYPMEEATNSGVATDSGRLSQPSTESALPVSGSVGITYALIFGGLFFILAGVWSWWIATNLGEELVV